MNRSSTSSPTSASTPSSTLTESDFRTQLSATYRVVERAFEPIDPDLAECEVSLGSLTVRFGDGTRLILSAQPSVRQLWLAAANRGIAVHFDFDRERQQWWDDKGKQIELTQLLRELVRGQIGWELAL